MANYCTILNNSICGNDDTGIQILYSSHNTIALNTITDRTYGIKLEYSARNVIVKNNISNNSVGIYFYSSTNNTIYLNVFRNNSVSSPGGNLWSYPAKVRYAYKGKQFVNYLGNYWDKYGGTDGDGDGIGDEPYEIGDGIVDPAPLMEPPYNYLTPPIIGVISPPNGSWIGGTVEINVPVIDEGVGVSYVLFGAGRDILSFSANGAGTI